MAFGLERIPKPPSGHKKHPFQGNDPTKTKEHPEGQKKTDEQKEWIP